MMRYALPLLLLLVACAEDPLCDGPLSASAGDVVTAGACRVEGDVLIPGGVTVVGDGLVLAGRVELGAGATLRSTRVESASLGVRMGEGATLEDVEVVVETGFGVAAESLGGVTLRRVQLRGSTDMEDVRDFATTPPTSATHATHGLYLEDVAAASLEEVSVRGFAAFGVLMVSSTVTWTRGDANENVSVGVMIAEGRATLSDVQVHDTIDSSRLHALTFGVVTGTAAVTSTRLSVEGTTGLGLFHVGGPVVHSELAARRNSSGGIRLESVSSADLSGVIAENDFVGVAAFNSTNVTIADAVITDTRTVLRTDAQLLAIEVGDGVQLVESLSGAAIARSTLARNERAGLVLELGGQMLDAGLFDDVEIIRGAATEQGAITQGGTRANDWDTGLTRSADTVAADDMFTGTLDTVGAVGPCFFPSPVAQVP